MTTRKKWTALLMLTVMLMVMTVPALAALPEQLEPLGNYANEHCPDCGTIQRFYRECRDTGYRVTKAECTAHNNGNCTKSTLYLSYRRTCQNNNTHQTLVRANHIASVSHSGSSSAGQDYSCPYGGHYPVLGW